MFQTKCPEKIRELYKSGLITETDYNRYVRIINNKNNLIKACQTFSLGAAAASEIENQHRFEFQKSIENGQLRYKLVTDINFISKPPIESDQQLNKATQVTKLKKSSAQPYNFHKPHVKTALELGIESAARSLVKMAEKFKERKQVIG